MAETLTPEIVQQALCSELQTLLALNPGAVTPDTPLQSLDLDSLRFVSLMLAIEHKFGVNLMQGNIRSSDMKTVRALSALVLARRQG